MFPPKTLFIFKYDESILARDGINCIKSNAFKTILHHFPTLVFVLVRFLAYNQKQTT